VPTRLLERSTDRSIKCSGSDIAGDHGMIWQYGHGWLGVGASAATSNLKSMSFGGFANQAVRRQNPSCSINQTKPKSKSCPSHKCRDIPYRAVAALVVD
jgi:hypothetical protein